MSNLQGLDGLKARLRAIRQDTFKPAGKEWADEAAKIARERVPNRNTRWSKGRLHDSIKRKSATMRKAIVVARYTGYFVDAGVVAHSLQRRKTRPKGAVGRTIFARLARKPHPGYAARPFRVHAAREALRRHPMAEKVIRAWNKAA